MPEDAPIVETPAVDAGATSEPAATPPATAAPVDPPADPDDAPVDIPGIEQLPESWQKHIRDLRDESANHRTSSKPFKDAFDGWSDADRDVMLALARDLSADPRKGAERMKALAETLLTDPEEPKTPPAGDGDLSKPVTPEDLDRLLDEREKKRKEADDEQKVITDAKALGYEQGTREYLGLLWEAANHHNGDLEAAHKALEAERQAEVTKYLERKRQEAENTPTVASGGDAPSNSKVPTTWAEARKSVLSKQ